MIQLPGAVLLAGKQDRVACRIPAYCLTPNDTVGREDISLLAAPACDTGLMGVWTMFSDISLRICSAEVGGLLPSQLFAFIESLFVH